MSGSKDGAMRLLDLESGLPIGTLMGVHSGAVRCVALSGDGRCAVSGSDDGSLIIWDMATLAPIGDPLQEHTDSVCSVSFSFDDVRIVSGSDDGTVRIWNAASREQIGDVLEPDMVYIDEVSESRDGCYIVARGFDRSVIWNRELRTIVWRSKEEKVSAENELSVDEEKVIVSSCGHQTPRVWPRAFPAYNSDVYMEFEDVYSNAVDEETKLGTMPSDNVCWRYEPNRKMLVAGLESGRVAICKLIDE